MALTIPTKLYHYEAFERYLKGMGLNGGLLYKLVQQTKPIPPDQKVIMSVRWKELSTGVIKYVGDYIGDQWGYDASWVIYKKDPRDPVFFNEYLFPRDYFKAEQAYVKRALETKLSDNAPLQAKALWAIDLMYHINSGLLATNLAAEALGDLSLINQITLIREYSALDELGMLIGTRTKKLKTGRGSYGEHALWTYAWDFWESYIQESPEGVQPLMCAEFSDFLLPPAACSSDMRNALYGGSRLIRGELQVGPYRDPTPLVSHTWQNGQIDLVNMMPWVEGGLIWSGLDCMRRLYGKNAQAKMAAIAAQRKLFALGMAAMDNYWLFLNIYRLDQWYTGKDTGWKLATDSRIPDLYRFKLLPAFLGTLERTPQLIEKQVISQDGASRDTIRVPNFAMAYQRGAFDAWANYFTKLRYQDYIKAGTHAWGSSLGDRALSAREMAKAIDEGWQPGESGTATAGEVAAHLGVGTAKLTTTALMGSAALGPAGIITGVTSIITGLFQGLNAKKAARAKEKAMMREYRRSILKGYNVIEQLFIRTIYEPIVLGGDNKYRTDYSSADAVDGVSSRSAAQRIATAAANLIALIPADMLPASWQKPALPPVSTTTSSTPTVQHTALFRHETTGERRWVMESVVPQYINHPEWAFVRREQVAQTQAQIQYSKQPLVTPTQPVIADTTKRRRVFVVAAAAIGTAVAFLRTKIK